MGEAPVLEHRGRRLSQSGVILDYLAETLGPLRLARRRRAPRDPALAAVRQPQAHELHGDVPLPARAREGSQSRRDGRVPQARRKRRGASSTRISPGERFVVGDRLTIVDLSMCGYLFWPDEIGVDWSAYPERRSAGSRASRATPRWRPPYELLPGHPRPRRVSKDPMAKKKAAAAYFARSTSRCATRSASSRSNRPDVHNAFNETLIAELTEALRALGDADDVRAVILAGNGPSFCAGADLNWMKKMAGYSRARERGRREGARGDAADAARPAEADGRARPRRGVRRRRGPRVVLRHRHRRGRGHVRTVGVRSSA